jgi:hypothetical protein
MPRCYKQGTKLVDSEKSSARESVKIGPERGKLQNLQGMAGEDTAGWKKHSGFCGDLWRLAVVL